MSKSFDRLVQIMARLRGEGGCPWDREQTHETLKPYLVEETYEVLDAIDSGDPETMKGELGDLLLQVVFHARMAEEDGGFDIDGVCNAISEKLIRRHPHVFAESDADTPQKVLDQWEKIKLTEKAHESRKSVLDGVPRSMPALLRAMRLQLKAGSAGFDWDSAEGAFQKVEEELSEFSTAFAEGKAKEMEEELGDLLFALVNMARFIEVNPEEALSKTIAKFTERFRHIERRIEESGRAINDVTLAEMDRMWEEAKTGGGGA
ncbi:MAG: nucleoside triphosphate pyrophosphohydrolase [Candidatus Nitrospinota bacterium M3_3B_026]